MDSLQIGGAEKSTLEIARNLTDFQVTVCVLFSVNPDLISDFNEAGISIESLNLSKRLWWLKGPRALSRLVKANHIDLVHASLFMSEIVTRLALRGSDIPNIGSFVNDSYAPERMARMPRNQILKLSVFKQIDRFTARWVTHFTSITQHIAESNAAALHIPKSKIRVIYRGRDQEDYQATQPDYTPGTDVFRFLMVARLLERKGYLEAIEAARILKQQGFKFLVEAAGEGHDRRKFEAHIEANDVSDVFVLLGKRKDVASLHSMAHVFLFPSHYEGQGGALVEAMFSAKPILATDIPVFREQVSPDKSAVLFNLFSSEDLADKMKWMINHYEDAKLMGLKARETAQAKFNIHEIAKQTNAFYISLLKGN